MHADPSMTSTKKLRMLPSRSSKRTPYWRRAAKPSGQLPSVVPSLPEPASRAAKRQPSAPVPAISKPICLPQGLILDNKTALSKSFFKFLPFIFVHFNGVLHTRKCILFNLSFKSTKSFPHLLSQVGIAFYKLGSKSFKYSKQVMGYQNLTITTSTCADPNGWDIQTFRNQFSKSNGNGFKHQTETTCLLQ